MKLDLLCYHWLTISAIILIATADFTENAMQQTPDLPTSSVCTSDSVFDVLTSVTLSDCIQECERRSLCQSVNYNRFNVACFLRRNASTPSSDISNSPLLCYHVEMDDINSTLSGPCMDRPCDKDSLCQKDKKSQLGYACVPRYCLSPPAVSNSKTLTKFPTKVGKFNTYVCNADFTMFGSATIQCLENATWSEEEMFCYPNCPAIPEPVGTSVTSWSTFHWSINTTVVYGCEDGYYNLTEPIITCNEHGDWSDFACTPHCYLNDLEIDLQRINYAEFLTIPPSPYTHTSVVTIDCSAGYYYMPFGLAPYARCTTTGQWNITSFICIPFCLQTDLHVNGGEIEQPPTEPFIVDSTASFRCIDGYYPYMTAGIGPTLECQITGTWVQSGHCYKYCGAPPDQNYAYIDDAGSPPYQVGEAVKYKCKFLANSGNLVLTCYANGDWEGAVHCCAITHRYDGGRCVWKIFSIGK